MKLGILSFNTEYTIRPDDLAVAAEERGFESIWFPEHTHIPASRESAFDFYEDGEYEFTEKLGDMPAEYAHIADPFVSNAAAAVATRTLKIGTGICLVTQHEPLALAKAVASLDRLSEGRFLFGIGAGWNQEEMQNHGTAFESRWRVLEERVAAMKLLWTEREATFRGEYVNFDRVWSWPKPLQKPHPPLILGTLASTWGRQRVADIADGWIPIPTLHQDLPADVADLHERLRAAGRDPTAVSITCFEETEIPEDDLKRYADYGFVTRSVTRCPTKDKDVVLRWLDRTAEMGHRIGAL